MLLNCRSQRTRWNRIVDDAVLRALAKWPNVPAAYGWLALDRRGNWSIKGERIGNPALVDFIGRNYEHDARGRWFFQNGPQRVFVRLEYTPYVLRTEPAASGLALRTHTGMPVRPRAAWLDDAGSLLVEFGDSVGVVHGQDLAQMLSCLRDARGVELSDDAMEALLQAGSRVPAVVLAAAAGTVPVGRIAAAEVAARFGFDPDPRPAPGEPEC
jgi:hypothetical protein